MCLITDISSIHKKVILAAAIPQIDLYISLVGALGGTFLVNNFKSLSNKAKKLTAKTTGFNLSTDTGTCHTLAAC